MYAGRFAPRAAYAALNARSGKKRTSNYYAERAEAPHFFMTAVANWRLDNAKSLAAMLQEKTARTPHTLRVAGARYARSHAARTYIPQVGCLFL